MKEEKKEDNLNQQSTILSPLPSLRKCIVIVFLGAWCVYKWGSQTVSSQNDSKGLIDDMNQMYSKIFAQQSKDAFL